MVYFHFYLINIGEKMGLLDSEFQEYNCFVK